MRDTIYIASDMHFGAPDAATSRERERRFVAWLDHIKPSVKELWLLGDLFDFWFEYKRAVPKGHLRFLGKLAELADAGIPIHIFVGNHDLWFGDYLVEEIGATVYRKPQMRSWHGKQFYLAHGDGLGPGDHGYKLMKAVFTNPLCKWLFARLHPNFGIGLASFFSHTSLKANPKKATPLVPEKEFLYQHVRDVLPAHPELDYFVFGHRHHFHQTEIAPGKQLIYLGDWMQFDSYLEISGEGVLLKKWLRGF
ncbi:MAG: UDP-2,3-diacylglucosamine diphosphatase [Bacteroidia bacterium]